ncbi:hypothetical protein AWB67_04661 [Caballeronia terrestris]|uniref:Lipoprotein n=2 Tax=Caballeronia terrestris TaxID=1226301 RepID=A0A158K0T4_9BURK|nr:hypothetical protein AWB67_04661 [Caballeronia terrestris]
MIRVPYNGLRRMNIQVRHVAATAMTAAVVGSSLAFAQPAAPPLEQSSSPQVGEKVSHMISRPTTAIEYAKNLKFIIDHDLLLQDDFYTEANLKDVFNLEEVSITNNGSTPERYISIAANPPAYIFPRIMASPLFGGSVPGATLVGGKSSHALGLITAGINFQLTEDGPSFVETQQIFGNDFVLFSSPTPPPHGPLANASAPHGNETWRKEDFAHNQNKVVTISFNAAAQLTGITVKVDQNKGVERDN